MVFCKYCNGSGKCPRCNGTGVIIGGFLKTQKDCTECNGLGKCKECKGRGKSDRFSVEIVKYQCPRCLSFKQIESILRPLETKCDNCGLTILIRK